MSTSSVAKTHGVNPHVLAFNYKEHISDFLKWDQKDHCERWLVYPENIGAHICIDESSVTQGELYTYVTNGDKRTQKGSLIAMIDGVKAHDISEVLRKIPIEHRSLVTEVSVDMANNMEKVARDCFPNASIVTDRFHVAQLVGEAVQETRVRERWIALAEENEALAQSKKTGVAYVAPTYDNGDTKKQLLARGRHLLFKPEKKWGRSQKIRAAILFANFPHIKSSYRLSMALRNIYETAQTVDRARELLERWHLQVAEKIAAEELATSSPDKKFCSSFRTVSKSIRQHADTILNFFAHRTTNALAECFNAKIKAFRSTLRGVKDLSFFLYRISMIFA